MEQQPWITDPLDTAAALRSQLNLIAAASQVLERSADTQKSRPYLAVLNQGICRMLRIVERMELGERFSLPDPLPEQLPTEDLADLLGVLTLRLEGVLSQIGIAVRLRCPPHLPLRGDGILLRQMILEMASCAAMAGTEITLSAAQRDGRIALTVTAGCAGTAEGRPDLPALLEEQEEQISIALARRIAQLHGGSLMVSPDGDGLLTLTAALPVGDLSGQMLLESPRSPWHGGGFDPVLVAMSERLPAQAFLPEELG